MSTPSITVVRQKTFTSPNAFVIDELYGFYCHWDGYPDGMGKDIALACIAAEKKALSQRDEYGTGYGTTNNRNWCDWFTKYLFAADNRSDYELMANVREMYSCYTYVVEGWYEMYGGKVAVDHLPVTIAVYHGGDDIDVDAPMFKGSPEEYMAWLECQKED